MKMRQKEIGFIIKALNVWLCASLSETLSMPLLGPDVMSFGSLPPLTVWQEAAFPIIPAIPLHAGLPAPKGTVFDGPDPGLNAAIITVPREPCPSGYRKDINDVCRLKFGYGPNPFFSFTPENFKGDVQFYMGLQVGGPPQPRRRGRARGRPRPSPNGQSQQPATPAPPSQPTQSSSSVDDDDD